LTTPVPMLNILASLLSKGGDDLPECLLLLGVDPLVPPYHEVGGLRAEWRQDECGGEKA
jgi:hypothetical protein